MTQQFTPGQRVIWERNGFKAEARFSLYFARDEGEQDQLTQIETVSGTEYAWEKDLTPAESSPVRGAPVTWLMQSNYSGQVVLAQKGQTPGNKTIMPDGKTPLWSDAFPVYAKDAEPLGSGIGGETSLGIIPSFGASSYGRGTYPPAQPVQVPDADAITEKIAEMLAGTWHCSRVWEAWHVGTMSEDDFTPVSESDTPRDIADAICALLAASQPANQPNESKS